MAFVHVAVIVKRVSCATQTVPAGFRGRIDKRTEKRRRTLFDPRSNESKRDEEIKERERERERDREIDR